MMEWEFHTRPRRPSTLTWRQRLEPRVTQELRVSSFTPGPLGHCFYFSDVAVRHPHLTYDLFGKEVSLARKAGMSTVAYYSLQFNNQIVLTHPDWGWVDEKANSRNSAGM